MSIYFNSQYLPELPRSEYVAWIDVMGIQSAMGRSLSISGNFVFKLHVAALESANENVKLYPIMDGFYASSLSQQEMISFLFKVFKKIAFTFVKEATHFHRFIIRGALSYGSIIHGSEVKALASDSFKSNIAHKDAILLGIPMIQANKAERSAPPFGVFIHESARSFSPEGIKPLHYVWWKWEDKKDPDLWNTTKNSLMDYYKWCKENSESLLYASERISFHENLAKQYFTSTSNLSEL